MKQDLFVQKIRKQQARRQDDDDAHRKNRQRVQNAFPQCRRRSGQLYLFEKQFEIVQREPFVVRKRKKQRIQIRSDIKNEEMQDGNDDKDREKPKTAEFSFRPFLFQVLHG